MVYYNDAKLCPILYCFINPPAELLQLYFFRHLELELLTQFPASNNEKYYYLWKIDMSNIKLLDQQSVY